MAPNRPRIIDIYENRILTRTERNEFGKWERGQKELRYRRPVNTLASGLRLVNLIIDLSVCKALQFVLIKYEILDPTPLMGLLVLFWLPIYYTISEYFFQQTIGKFFTNSIVVDEYGDRPDFKTIVVRSVIRIIPFEPFSFLGNDRGWHDAWTDTYVITRSELEQIRELMADPENLDP